MPNSWSPKRSRRLRCPLPETVSTRSGSALGQQLFAVAALACAFFGLAQMFGNQLLYLPFGACVAIFMLSLVVRHEKLAVTAPAVLRVRVGQSVQHQLTIRNLGKRRNPAGRFSIETRGLTTEFVWYPELPPGASATVNLLRTGVSRGVAENSTIRFQHSDVTGAAQLREEMTLEAGAIVHPAIALPRAALSARPGDDGDDGRAAGVELSGVRDWSPGDPMRAIHWRATARHGQLAVVERFTSGQPAVHLLVLGNSFGAAAEQALAVAARTATVALFEGRPLLLRWVGNAGASNWQHGTEQSLLDWFARIGSSVTTSSRTAQPKPTLDAALADLLPGAMLVIGDYLEPAMLARVTSELAAIDPLTGAPLGMTGQKAETT